VDRAARRVVAEKKKEKKDAEKARARKRMRAQDALEKRRRRQERDGLLREPSLEMPDDNDDDDDDDESDDMAAHLGLSPDPRPSQGSPSQPPSGPAPSVLGAGTSRSQPEEQGQTDGVLDPLADVTGATPGGRADPPVFHEEVPVLAVQEVGPLAVATLGQAAPSSPRASEAEAAPKPVSGHLPAAPAGLGPEGPPRRHDWPWSGAGRYLRIPLF
jgi:hypothetical protein